MVSRNSMAVPITFIIDKHGEGRVEEPQKRMKIEGKSRKTSYMFQKNQSNGKQSWKCP